MRPHKIPKAKFVKACNSMKAMGIAEEIVKPVLVDLAKIYDNNWTLIEDENYRVLVDAIFEHQEIKVHLFVLVLVFFFQRFSHLRGGKI